MTSRSGRSEITGEPYCSAWPGIMLILNLWLIIATMVRSSSSAMEFPMHWRGPAPKGK